MLQIAFPQALRCRPLDAPLKQPVEPPFQFKDAAEITIQRQDIDALPQVDRFPKQLLHLDRPLQARALLNQALQITQLMRQAQLKPLGRGLRFRHV